MNDVLAFLAAHGYAIVFAWVLIDELGVPVPAIPVVIAAGALARDGSLNPLILFALSVSATVLGNLVWYEAGRRKGARILRLVCRISLEPDSCVRNTRTLFSRFGDKSLILAHFLPGLSTVVHPLSGLSGMPLLRFIALDAIGAAAWTIAFGALGWIFRTQLENAAALASTLGSGLGVGAAGVLAIYLGVKLLQRSRLLRDLRIARITPEELNARMDAKHELVIVDLRQDDDVAADPFLIPGAIRVALDAIEQAMGHIPREQEIVLYCS